jgi:Flp pilus assembly protein TadD
VETVDIEDQSKLRVLDSLTKDIELNFKSARELFPDDADMLNNEAEFSKFMQDMPRALSILEKAYKTNKTNLFISLRLARHYFYQQDQREEG